MVQSELESDNLVFHDSDTAYVANTCEQIELFKKYAIWQREFQYAHSQMREYRSLILESFGVFGEDL